MGSNLVFIYDGECPFCNHFAELLELKSDLIDLQLKNARDNPPEIPSGYDMDKKGANLLKDGEILHGASAINWLCSQLKDPSDVLLDVLRLVFKSHQRTKLIFPFLIWARRLTLRFKGVPRKLGNIQ